MSHNSLDSYKPCKGENSNVCVGESCYGESCLKTQNLDDFPVRNRFSGTKRFSGRVFLAIIWLGTFIWLTGAAFVVAYFMYLLAMNFLYQPVFTTAIAIMAIYTYKYWQRPVEGEFL